MRSKAFIVALACIIALAACTSERQESAVAGVVAVDDAPCFLIDADANSLQQIQVVDSKGKKKWQASFDKGATLKKHQCLLYGRKLPGMLVEEAPTPLATDEMYTVAIIAPSASHPDNAFAHVANFCLLSKNGNNTVVMVKDMPMNAQPSCQPTNEK